LKQARGFVKPLRVLGQLEDFAAIGPLALEHRTGIMETMGQDMDLGVRPSDEFAVHPDMAVELVEGNGCHENLPRADAPDRCALTLLRLAQLAQTRGKLKEVPGKSAPTCLFVRQLAKRLAKITSPCNLCQQG
jgi:hypothetical protein